MAYLKKISILKFFTVLLLGMIFCGIPTPAKAGVAPAALTYSQPDLDVALGATIVDDIPAAKGGQIFFYSIDPPDLPPGLNFDPNSGIISGVPTQAAGGVYTVTAGNNDGSTTANLTIRVSEPSLTPMIPPPSPSNPPLPSIQNTLPTTPPPASVGHQPQSQPISYECDLSGNVSPSLQSCPNSYTGGGFGTTTKAVTSDGSCSNQTAAGNPNPDSYCAARGDAFTTAIAPIDLTNNADIPVGQKCFWVDNANTKSIFIPFKSNREWAAFLNNAPLLKANLVDCAVPYTVSKTSPLYVFNVPYSGCAPQQIVIPSPSVYGRVSAAGASVIPAQPASIPNLTCNGNTTVASQLTWTADSYNKIGPGKLSWDTTRFYFSPNILLRVSDSSNPQNSGTSITVNSKSSVQLTWSVTNSATSCMAVTSSSTSSNPPWGGNEPLVGNQLLVPGDNSIYYLTCTDSHNLSSVATVTVTINPPSP